MKVDLVYPKIPDSRECLLKKCWAFEKYDGTNLHWTWDNDFGWLAFGTRRHEYDLDEGEPVCFSGKQRFYAENSQLQGAVELFFEQYAKPLEQMFIDNCHFKVTVFTEFFGAKSFAGSHVVSDPKQLVLFDVQVEKDFVSPEQFIKDYAKFNVARVLYHGKYSGQLVQDVRKGKFKVNEGVVIKGEHQGQRIVVKVKTDDYMARLKLVYKDQWSSYWE